MRYALCALPFALFSLAAYCSPLTAYDSITCLSPFLNLPQTHADERRQRHGLKSGRQCGLDQPSSKLIAAPCPPCHRPQSAALCPRSALISSGSSALCFWPWRFRRYGSIEARERLQCIALEMRGQLFREEELAPIRVRTGPAFKRSCPVCVCLRPSAANNSLRSLRLRVRIISFLPFALCAMLFALCAMLFALCAMRFAVVVSRSDVLSSALPSACFSSASQLSSLDLYFHIPYFHTIGHIKSHLNILTFLLTCNII
jgi:hypothetical protein